MKVGSVTNEEKAKEVAMIWRAYGFPYATIYKIVLESLQWKEQEMRDRALRWLDVELSTGDLKKQAKDRMLTLFKDALE